MNPYPKTLPAVRVNAMLGRPGFGAMTDVGQPPMRKLQLDIEAALQGLLDDLGIPGAVEFAFQACEGEPLTVMVREVSVLYSADLTRQVWEYVLAAPLGSVAPGYTLADWCHQNLPGKWPADPGKWGPATMFLSRLVVEIVKQHPEYLFGREQAEAWLAHAAPDSPEETTDAGELLEIARRLLELKLSIADRDLVLPQIREGRRIGLCRMAIVEDLVQVLRPRSIAIEMHPDAIRRFLSVELKDRESRFLGELKMEAADELFALASDGLFYELGIRVPPVEFRANQALAEDGFAICVNHAMGIPYKGLTEGRLLVNETPDRLRLLQIEALPAQNPVGTFCAVADAKDKDKVKGLGLTTWEPLGFVVLAFAAEIRHNAARLLDSGTVESELAQLREAFPDLVLAAMDAVPTAMLTQVLRGLLREEISIRDLRTILGRVATYDYVFADTSRRIVFDDRLAIDDRLQAGSPREPELYIEFVRQGMKNYLGHKYTRGTSSLSVYLLSPEVEGLVLGDLAAQRGDAGAARLSASRCEDLRTAIAKEHRSNAAGNAVILTFAGIRRAVRKLVEDQFPQLAVLAYEELPPEMNISPLARVTLPEKETVAGMASS